MNESHANKFGRWPARALLAGALFFATVLGAGCSIFCKPQTTVCTKAEPYVVYYYRYKDAKPDQSDIAYIEYLSPGSRCFVVSPKKAPVFPDGAVSDSVKSGAMKIDIPEAKIVQILGKADIAVYYAAPTSTPSHTPFAVEDLTGVSRLIETVSVIDEGPAGCGACPSIPCDGYSCCKRPPC